MAIVSAKTLRDSLESTLNDAFRDVYEADVWAVHADYLHETMTYKVIKIEPWELRSPSGSYGLHRIAGAVDEMDAYKQFMERANGWVLS